MYMIRFLPKKKKKKKKKKKRHFTRTNVVTIDFTNVHTLCMNRPSTQGCGKLKKALGSPTGALEFLFNPSSPISEVSVEETSR